MSYSIKIATEKNMLQLGRMLAHACVFQRRHVKPTTFPSEKLSGEPSVKAGENSLESARSLKCLVYLYGNLGAGKTTLVRGFLRGLGYTQSVKSPTYTIVEPYEVTGQFIYHFDLYRLTNAEELVYIGARDYFSEDAICLIEWPEKGTQFVPTPDLELSLTMAADQINPEVTTSFSDNDRLVRIEGVSDIGKNIQKFIEKTWVV